VPFINENTITLTGSYVNADSSYASGSLDFAPASFLVDAAGKQIIAPSMISVSLNNLGHFSVALPATDDPDINPTGWTYTVTERISGAPIRQFSMSLPSASAGSTLDMSAIVPAVASTGTAAPYLLVPSGTPSVGQVPVVTAVSPLALGWGAGGGGTTLTPTAVKTANYTAAAGDFIPVDTTSGAKTITLPTAPADKAQIAVKHVTQGGTNAVTIAAGGSDVFNKAGGSTSLTLSQVNQGMVLQYKASSGIWYVIGDSLSLAALQAANSATFQLQLGADATTKTQAIPRWVTTPWQPWTKPYQSEPDTLFMPGLWTTEADFLAAGGRLAYAWDTYYAGATTKATVSAGKYGAPLVTGNAQGAYAVLPLDGVIAFDKFTVETSLISVGADFTAQTFGTAYTLLAFDGTGAQNEGLMLRRTAATTLAAVLTNGSTTITASLTIASGDIPADTETGVSLTYDGTTLTLILGNNTKSATATGSVLYGSVGSADMAIGGLLVNPGTGTTINVASTPSNVWKVAVPHVRRYPRVFNTQSVTSQPGVLIDATIPGKTWPNYLTGVFSQYYGWKNTTADGSGGLGTSIRDQAIAATGAAGAPVVRIDHVFDKVTVTGTAAAPTVTDWSLLDGPMDKWVAANPSIAFQITFDFTPSVLGATVQTPPTDSAGFASLCVQAVTHWLAKGYKLAALSLWNEPSNGTFWSGTQGNMQTLWAAVAGALNTNFGGNALVPKLGTTDGVGTIDMQNAMLTQSVSSSLPIGSYHLHDYSGQPRNVRNNISAAQAQIVAAAATGSPGVWVTEWNDNQNVLAQIYTTPNSLSTRVPDRVYKTRHAAMVHAIVQEMWNAGAVGATYTRLTILDDAFTAIERTLGLFTADDPPRPLPAFAAMSMMWKLNGAVVPTNATTPALRCIATWDSTGKKLTAVIGSYCPARIGQPAGNVAIQWMNLPASFTWKMWRFTDADVSDGRPRLVSTGDQTNLPLGVELGAHGLYCIQISTTLALATFTPENVAGKVMDFDASNLALTDGAAVSSWADAGSGGQALVQATGSAQPIYKTNIVNGKPVVRFLSTSSQTMVASYGSDPLGTGAYSLVAVIYDNNSDGVFSQFRNSGDGGIAIKGHLRGANIRTIQRNNANTLVSPTSSLTNNGKWEVCSLVWDGATLTLRVNGTMISTIAATGVITTNRFYLGSDNGTGTYRRLCADRPQPHRHLDPENPLVGVTVGKP
jgi:hypothetical protein